MNTIYLAAAILTIFAVFIGSRCLRSDKKKEPAESDAFLQTITHAGSPKDSAKLFQLHHSKKCIDILSDVRDTLSGTVSGFIDRDIDILRKSEAFISNEKERIGNISANERSCLEKLNSEVSDQLINSLKACDYLSNSMIDSLIWMIRTAKDYIFNDLPPMPADMASSLNSAKNELSVLLDAGIEMFHSRDFSTLERLCDKCVEFSRQVAAIASTPSNMTDLSDESAENTFKLLLQTCRLTSASYKSMMQASMQVHRLSQDLFDNNLLPYDKTTDITSCSPVGICRK